MREGIDRWLDSVSATGWTWYAKRLSANDTGATDSHQAGLYIPKPVLWAIFPSLQEGSNPDASFPADIMPYGQRRNLRAIWYNQGTRNETRITRWNQPSRILDPDLTGGLVVIAFRCDSGNPPREAAVWICQNTEEEAAVEERIGMVEPGEGTIHHPSGIVPPAPILRAAAAAPPHAPDSPCGNEIPPDWLTRFPSAEALVRRAFELVPARAEGPDTRLLLRRRRETELFYGIESVTVLPRIRTGFPTVDDFVDYANSVTNRRKSRSGRSLELHLREIFTEEGIPFSHGEISESQKRPDFLFPSATAYRDATWPDSKLRMLAAKTTCKDRWRQILNEADRIDTKHLITLQEGVSENQFREMRDAGVVLVVPLSLHAKFPPSIRERLLNLGRFIADTSLACV